MEHKSIHLRLLIFSSLLCCFTSCNFHKKNNSSLVEVELSSKLDTLKVCANPHKGWYHHILDNGIGGYHISSDSIFNSFPGMDHLYIRIAWSYLEPEEGRYDWRRIDEVVEKYVPLGYGISFRITSKETGKYPGSVGQEVKGIQYATPYWLIKAGAKGTVADNEAIRSWVPDWDDPVYLEKLNNFHKAFAERYDGRPWIRYIDVGSIGEWGEGHTHFSTGVSPSVDEVKANIDVFLKNYKKTQIIVTDDLLYYLKKDEEVGQLYDYAISHGISLRDDSPMVDWYLQNNLPTWSVSHPRFYMPLYLTKPIIFELQHYSTVKSDGNWLGKNGRDTIFSLKTTGAEIFKKAMEIMHATYIGYHGFAEEWLQDNPDLTKELLNRSGYWFTIQKAEVPEAMCAGDSLRFSLNWYNLGVAPAYHNYALAVLLEKDSVKHSTIIDKSFNQSWLPAIPCIENYSVFVPSGMNPGHYNLKIKLVDLEDTGRDIDLALSDSIRDKEGYFYISEIKCKK
jgi:hypothetical protein